MDFRLEDLLRPQLRSIAALAWLLNSCASLLTVEGLGLRSPRALPASRLADVVLRPPHDPPNHRGAGCLRVPPSSSRPVYARCFQMSTCSTVLAVLLLCRARAPLLSLPALLLVHAVTELLSSPLFSLPLSVFASIAYLACLCCLLCLFCLPLPS